jgi:hypothetical protein
MQNGLGTNATLEHLEFKRVVLCDDSNLWCRAFSFVHTNKAIKSLAVHVSNITHAGYVSHSASCISDFRIDIAAMLQENTSLESLSFACQYPFSIKAEDFFKVVTALQDNTTLKTLIWGRRNESFQFTADESRQMASLLKKNFALESLPDINLKDLVGDVVGDVGAILRLNGAGRRYLIEDGSSISKGVEVLSRVNNDINCVFLHLLENPRLCDRSAVEIVTGAGESNGSQSMSPNASSAGGKREQASVHDGKESRRRLA